jgi:hypothetical protein
MPAARPSADASAASTRDSASTPVTTCRLVAPTARRSATSRVRWAMTIEKVLKMMNEPTKRAMTANTSKNVLKKAMLSRMSC